MCCISWRQNHNIFISGGEDCTLRISHIDERSVKNSYVLENLGIFDGHLSGIKCISVIELHKSAFQYLVFSGGGRAQMKVWGINIKNVNFYNYMLLHASCSDVNSHMLYGQDQYCKKSWQGTKSCVIEPETRYMDFYAYYPSKKLNYVLIFIACADGYLR